jgi:hypothetical protein
MFLGSIRNLITDDQINRTIELDEKEAEERADLFRVRTAKLENRVELTELGEDSS